MNRLLRWIARLASAANAILFVLLWVHAPPRFSLLSPRLLAELGLLSAAVLGLLLGWWRERVGGAVAVACLAGFLGMEFGTAHHFPVEPSVFAMLLPALLYLIVGPKIVPPVAS